MATLVPSLVALRSTFNRLCPSRNKESDGWIGDSAHAQRPSDHNPDETGTPEVRDSDSVDEVHAIDITNGLNATDALGAFTLRRAVDTIVANCRNGKEKRLRYVIFDKKIASAPDWEWKPYGGSNPHQKHAHFSASYTSSHEADDRAWDIGYKEDALTPAEIDAIATAVVEKWINRTVTNRSTGNLVRLGTIMEYQDAVAEGTRSVILSAIAELTSLIMAGSGNTDTAAVLAAIQRMQDTILVGLAEMRAYIPTAEVVADAVVDEIAS